MTRRSAHRRASAAAKLPLYASDLRPVRGRCLKRGCASRWAIVRVSLDFRAERVDRIAYLECASCGRRWRRVKVPPLVSEAGYQAVRLELILPAHAKRWFARGRWHREGEDGIVVADATLADHDEAARDHRATWDRAADCRARARVKREAQEAADHVATMALLDRLAQRDAERAAEDAAAASREAD